MNNGAIIEHERRDICPQEKQHLPGRALKKCVALCIRDSSPVTIHSEETALQVRLWRSQNEESRELISTTNPTSPQSRTKSGLTWHNRTFSNAMVHRILVVPLEGGEQHFGRLRGIPHLFQGSAARRSFCRHFCGCICFAVGFSGDGHRSRVGLLSRRLLRFENLILVVNA